MLDQDVNVYGVAETFRPGDDLDLRVEELSRLGYTHLDGGFDAAALDELRAGLARVYARQAESFGAGLERSADADVARALLASEACFLRLATAPPLMALCKRVLGENFVLLQQNGLINRPSRAHYQLRWHRDLPYQHWVASKPVALAALFCLDPFNAETGGTYMLPGSHLHPIFPSDPFVRAQQRVMEAPPGTFVVMDAMIFHRAGRNSSAGPRRAVNHLIGLPFLAQQIDLPRLLGGAHAQDPFLARYLGYRWGPAESVDAWRRERMKGP